MGTLAELPTKWIKEIPGDLFKLDQTPLLGYSLPFGWEDFAKQIEASLHVKELKFSPQEWRWRQKEELFDGLGSPLKSVAVNVVPLAGAVFLAMPEREILNFMNFLLQGQASQSNAAIDTEFQQALYRFLTIEIFNAFDKVCPDKDLSLNSLENEDLPESHCLCQDIAISLPHTTMHCRLFLTPEFRTSWMQRYLKEQTDGISTSPLADKLSVTIHLEAGKVDLTPSEWKQINVGDCILLDSCTLTPDEDKGRIQLVIDGIPFFRGKIKQGNIKILEHPLYHEVNTPMPPKDHEDDELFDDSELDSEIESEIETHTEESEIESDFDSYTESEIESDLDSHTESETNDDFTLDDEDLDETKTESDHPPSKATSARLSPRGTPLSLEEIPLTIVVEVGRIQMSIKKLLELQPGNMLDLNIHPEEGIDLVLNGKCIAKGELLRIGDALGVRIVDLS